ncbi:MULTISPECIES: VIT family protein [Fructobacillus]|jgi:vacuolar iron transporter family protein|uniref:VIT1/CCC1 family (Ccc1) n=1 Tax=Fructobacillus cardui TaxID=2893170 RepID=A0ABM9MM90_9LACO|nr:VIT family protein [Fructobacillus sp. EFB-N1]KMK53090.1 VIT family protein [Fructobacillus sp. EFB-N1]CAK1226421.1 Predicted Fe2+/Mn2+ transporter [Fructobacillus cardui]CAK1227582.1 Predicted Fe2+/Mn2+ transporter [Fructobacillus cardui]CAK1232375.1 Predicted Fe2+/Mn2+ transporter [Fructobacillus cardui]
MKNVLSTVSDRREEKKSGQTMEERLNAIRAGILGSNDGILTVVGVVFSVAAATTNRLVIVIAALSDLLACALSMGSGEFAAVSSQSDSERVAVDRERVALKENFDEQLATVQAYYEDRGVTAETAKAIAVELLAQKPLETILSVKYDMTLGHYVSPIEASFASTFSAALGGALPLLALLLSSMKYQYIAAILATVVAVSLTGLISAFLSKGMVKRAVIRNIWIGLLTIVIHFSIGKLF